MWRTTEAFGVPGKRHVPPLNATSVSFEQLSRHQDLDKGDVGHYGGFWCPGDTPFATFNSPGYIRHMT